MASLAGGASRATTRADTGPLSSTVALPFVAGWIAAPLFGRGVDLTADSLAGSKYDSPYAPPLFREGSWPAIALHWTRATTTLSSLVDRVGLLEVRWGAVPLRSVLSSVSKFVASKSAVSKRAARTLAFVVCLSLVAIAADRALRYKKIDTNHSTIGFVVPILGGMSEVTGKFSKFDVEVDWIEKDGKFSDSALRATIQVASIDTGIPDRDQHLLSADFFDAKNHPTIEFRSRSITARKDGFLAKGDLTMRGKTRAIDLPFRVTGQHVSESGKVMMGLAAEFVIDRQEYGVSWRHPDPAFVGDNVRIILRVLTKLKAPE